MSTNGTTEERTAVMSIEPQRDTWMTRELVRIPICDMSDEHLINTLVMFKRNADEDQEEQVEETWRQAINTPGELAAEAGGDVAEELSGAHWTRWSHRMWAPMFKDALRRGGDVAEKAVAIL